MTTDWAVMLASNEIILIAFIAGLLMLGASLLFFRSVILFIAEIVLIALLLTFGGSGAIGVIFSIIQFAVFLYGLYRLKAAIDRNYMLVLEKIHQKDPELTKNGNGTEGSFL